MIEQGNPGRAIPSSYETARMEPTGYALTPHMAGKGVSI